ncbi:hypothetical protein [Pseudolactococcus carnosus]|uniref:Uncharacterized protein n=1 Tax=Pseudolactococcus carnosus TaxID=2749961 RepID=A0ABT0AS88_9LACT|nr:hypothetical protein [Lactococcus carnosus]MCJ1989435.1 hypothetical protein [Lactococcus carnosus]
MGLSEEEIISAYQNTRRQLEDAEDQIRYLQRKGEQETESAIQEMNSRLRHQALDGQAVSFIQQEMYRAHETFDDIANQEKRKSLQKLEDNELNYRQKLREIR